MELHKDALTEIMGEEEYKKDLEVITKLEDNEKNKGKFIYDRNSVDTREP